jgi:hypothetical protein
MSLEPLDTEIIVRWKKTETSPWQQSNVKLSIEIGIPQFALDTKEIDFKTIYLNGKRTVNVVVRNNGTATCLWKLLDTERICVTPTSGEILPSQTQQIEIEFSATDFEPLSEALIFDTDVGRKTIHCVGIIGVSYLQIAPEFLNLDFGIIQINKSHSVTIPISNTGRRDVEYETCLTSVQSDGIDLAPGDIDIFSLECATGVLGPGQVASVKLNCHPTDYNARISCSFVITTKDEEEHRGCVEGVGGKAIIKIMPPIAEDSGERPNTAEVKSKPGSSGEGAHGVMINATLESYAAHVENLQEILICLQTEPDDGKSSISASMDDLSGDSQTVFDGSNTKMRRSKLRVAKRNAEKARLAKITELGIDPKSLIRKSQGAIGEDSFDTGEFPDESEEAKPFSDRLNSAEERIESNIRKTANPPKFGAPKSAFGRYRPGARRNVNVNGASSSDPYFNTNGEANGMAGPLREIIQGLREKMDALSTETDVEFQKGLVEDMSKKIIEQTGIILSAVKDKLEGDVGDIPNRDALVSATRRLQAGYHGFESNGVVQDSLNMEMENDFDLGKYKGGEPSKISLLFNLPNVGNISFDYEIKENDENNIVPPELGISEIPVRYFQIVEPTGIVHPSMSVNLSASFQASSEGHYSQGYTIFSSAEPVLSFTVSANIGRPKISLSPDEGIDFGLVVKGGQSSTSSIFLKNIGSFADSWRIQSHVNFFVINVLGPRRDP